MMSETPQAVVRVTFLLGVTLLFAALWQGDRAPGRHPSGTSADAALTEGSGPRSRWEAAGSDLPKGESGEMVIRHAESDIDRSTWEQAGGLPPWSARGTDLPEGESGIMMHRHAESEVDPDNWERADSRPPWTAPGTDLPQGESESMARGDDREASTSVNKVRSRTLSSRPESHLKLAFTQPAARNLHDVARSDLPPGITAGTYRIVDNAGRTARITLSLDELAGAPARSPRPLYESAPAPGQRIYWIRIELTGSDKKIAANRVLIRKADLANTPASTMATSAALLTGSLNRTPSERSSSARWLDHASRWMDRALELVRAVPAEQPQGVRR
ncbi:hypothetical protein Mal4_32710 [Maioricimonas rarisocia]|uniref:Uncharacterized protein n=1 Tax=Maioricimonas rarisocia TaxID=2528026 RepID=A0A517Z916_9PLAN|nr:hypothetical protein [Maioricimonas rarisocia]QDU38939.1 hypothetical protein Mal4_32710 [Maioricimonas rarisocia]